MYNQIHQIPHLSYRPAAFSSNVSCRRKPSLFLSLSLLTLTFLLAWGAPSAPEDSFSAVRAPESSFSACAAPGAARGYGGSDAGNAGETDGDGDGDAPRDNTCR